MKKKINIGTRGSKLALWQAEHVKKLIETSFPETNIDIKVIRTTGDIEKNKPLFEINRKGIFIKEIEESLITGSIDIAVHSLKDMPVDITDDLEITGYTDRGNPNDVLILKEDVKMEDLKKNAVIGCGSLRRQKQLINLFPDIRFADIRGNIETRIKKVENGQYDGTIITQAALDRLGLSKHTAYKFSVDEMVPAAGQGIICIEIRKNDNEIRNIVSSVNNESSMIMAEVERNCLKKLGGGCSVPFGIHTCISGDDIITYCFLSDNNDIVIKKKYIKPYTEYIKAADEITEDLFNSGADKIVESFK